MVYTYNFALTLVDVVALFAAIFVLGVMAGHKLLPKPIDMDKEELINKLFNENIAMKMERLNWGPGQNDD